MGRSNFGSIRTLPSGRYQIRYTGPDGSRHQGEMTFDRLRDARDALAEVATDIRRKAWTDDRAGAEPFGVFAGRVLSARSAELAPRTLEGYRTLLHNHLLPTFGRLHVRDITVQLVDDWWSAMGTRTGKVNRRNAYFVLSSVMRRAVRYGLVRSSPCMVEGAGKNVAADRPYLSVEDFENIVDHLPESMTAPVWLLFGAHLRVGELCGLNRRDVGVDKATVTVSRQAQRLPQEGVVLTPTKTGTTRTIVMLKPARELIAAHIADHPMVPNSPLFINRDGQRLSARAVRLHWERAREAAGLPWAHLHDIRHTSLTEVARVASPRETMHRGGHRSVAAAMRYQHATEERDNIVAEQVSAALAR